MSQRESTNRTASASFSAMSRRMWGAAMLRAEAYEEVEADQSANRQAFAVVLLSSVSAGVGSLSNSGGSGVLYAIAAALVGWWVWAYITYLVGTRLLPVAETRADHGELLRTIGFSSTPGLFCILALIPSMVVLCFLPLEFPFWNAQIKAMKEVAGSLRLELSQYRELEAFAAFASDLDAASKAQLERGARLVELLKQPQYTPYSVEDQVVAIFLGTKGHLDSVPVEDVARFEREVLEHGRRRRVWRRSER